MLSVEEDFFSPETYGFLNCNPADTGKPCLKLSLFPHRHYAKSSDYGKILAGACGISDMKAAMSCDEFKKMSGVIISSSLSGPNVSPAVRGHPENSYLIDQFEAFKNPPSNKNIAQWLSSYPIGMLNMIISNYYVNMSNETNINAGINIFIDITQDTLSGASYQVGALLSKWDNLSCITRIGDEAFIKDLNYAKTTIIDLVKMRCKKRNIDIIPLYEFLTIALYSCSSYFKYAASHPEILDTSDDTKIDAIANTIKDTIVNEHNIRVYYYIREGRLKFTGEPPNGTGTNPLSSVWLGVGQFLRYLIWAQDRFTIDGVEGAIFPIKYMYHRDAHACTPTRLSSIMDREFINKSKEESIIIFARSIKYRSNQHIVVDHCANNPENKDMGMLALESDDTVLKYKMGLLAGFTTSKNNNAYNTEGSCVFIKDEWLRYPFISPLKDNFPVTIPSNSPGHTTKDVNQYNNYWGYGLDEHVLGYIFRERVENQQALDIKILMHNIDFISEALTAFGKFDRNAYWKPYVGFVYDIAMERIKKHGDPKGGFLSSVFTDTQNYVPANKTEPCGLLGPHTIFHTLFGNISNGELRQPSIMMHYINKSKEMIEHPEHKKFFELYKSDFDRFASLIKNINRFDRFDYYNNPPLKEGLTSHTKGYIENLTNALTVDSGLSIREKPGRAYNTLYPPLNPLPEKGCVLFEKDLLNSLTSSRGGKRNLSRTRRGLKKIHTRKH